MDSTTATDLWDRLAGSQSGPSVWTVVGTGLVALAMILPPRVWRVTRNAITIAHEGGHGLVALLGGRTLDGIRLHSDTSGLTVSRGRPTGFGMVLTAAAGYPAPSLLGLAGAWALSTGHVTALLWVAAALLAAMLVMIRNAYGALTVVLTGAAFVLVSWLAGPEVRAAFAYGVVWFLLLGGVRPSFELQRKRRFGAAADSDADQLGRLTGVTPVLWLLFFHVVALAALLAGGNLLLRG
ncbi:M50 family metallopeptidase [Streptomyces mobaraensis NBRC 13819 = DSM 40847]|uniref:Putative integral membrane protein n=1 Tax=Streptomyces mobaraensis (strain ATCC 29032 / DSM 40847 / JCM 4168 / NBRC 13819 / NCIMB 11159 / IPCR 16-22) TaxID=1223523 RepID=M3ABL8_STRM1|nr:M50 family metallopeptidase [Streptomyces mobaraensis]EMF02589.1 putative integral membrane protein [Streptomyces mobaraensis NBRC 13819 = DSM 40847]QTT75623.1 M50 family metallopeptidase [Streptomyces mobaraensis NBRC 13819 = DSM 40847]